MTLWKGRFEKPMSKTMASIGQSLAIDLRLLPYEVEVNRAYAYALGKIGILSDAGVEKLLAALDTILKEYDDGEYDASEFPDEDVHTLIERRLIALAGADGAKIHTGRSRNDLILTDVKLYLKDECVKIEGLIGQLGRAIVKLADDEFDTMLPGYTHMQRAQPIYFAHYLYSFCFALVEDAKRIERILSGQLCQMPLGAGAMAGSAFPIDREWIARKLGFDGVTENSMHTVSSRDEFLEIGSALSILMVHLSRYAEDLILWSTSELGFVSLDESVSTGSSMMPQKKNPDSLELIRGKSARVIGLMQSLFVMMKGLPHTYARDMQEDKPALFDMLSQARLCLMMFAEVMSTLKVNRDAMKKAIAPDLMATDLADYLVKKGMPFREAHEAVAKLFRSREGARELTLDMLKEASPLFETDAMDLMKPEHSASLRGVTGGTSLDSLKAQQKILKRFFGMHAY
jgi:argininosuccinate lyase